MIWHINTAQKVYILGWEYDFISEEYSTADTQPRREVYRWVVHDDVVCSNTALMIYPILQPFDIMIEWLRTDPQSPSAGAFNSYYFELLAWVLAILQPESRKSHVSHIQLQNHMHFDQQ